MSKKITVTLVPDASQVQQLFDTMYRYHELCNYISHIIFQRGCSRPINLYYWEDDRNYKNLYYQVRGIFLDINSNMITIAFRKVAKAYSQTKPTEALQFNGDIDFSSYTVSLISISPPPINYGMLTISTLAGRQKMHFTFDDNQREKLHIALSLKRYCEYKLSFYEGAFYLRRNLSDSKIKAYSTLKNHMISV